MSVLLGINPGLEKCVILFANNSLKMSVLFDVTLKMPVLVDVSSGRVCSIV